MRCALALLAAAYWSLTLALCWNTLASCLNSAPARFAPVPPPSPPASPRGVPSAHPHTRGRGLPLRLRGGADGGGAGLSCEMEVEDTPWGDSAGLEHARVRAAEERLGASLGAAEDEPGSSSDGFSAAVDCWRAEAPRGGDKSCFGAPVEGVLLVLELRPVEPRPAR